MEPVEPWTADAVAEPSIELEDPLINLSEELAGLSDEDDSELFDGDPVGVYTIALEQDEPAIEVFESVAGGPGTRRLAAFATRARSQSDRLEVEPPARDSSSIEPLVDTVFVEPPEPPRADIEEWAPMYLFAGPHVAGARGDAGGKPGAANRAARLDRARRLAPPGPRTARARPSDGASAGTKPLVRKQRSQPKKAKPVQDEWGFFDPEQCGFSTLLAKLEEITDEVRTRLELRLELRT